ncbi:MAG: hypothetical protein QNK11_03670 [Legionella sp.]|nr:hypothetical protein [Legionella sp.]
MTKLNQPDNKGRTPAHIAALNKRINTLKKLKALGSDLDQQDHKGQTPKDIAVAMHNKDALDAIILNDSEQSDTKSNTKNQNRSFQTIKVKSLDVISEQNNTSCHAP